MVFNLFFTPKSGDIHHTCSFYQDVHSAFKEHTMINAQNEGAERRERRNFSTHDLVFSQAYRWKSSRIRFRGISFRETFPRLDLPILDSLYYRCVHPEEGPRHSGPNSGDTPSLRYVRLSGRISQIPLPWSQILHYDGFPEELEDMRPARNQLQTCILRGSISAAVFSIRAPLSPIVFTKLTSLKLPFSFGSHMDPTLLR